MAAPVLGINTGRKLHFGPDYEEVVQLRDGRVAHLVMLGAQHAPQLARGFARLSMQSRYRRFMTGIVRLSDNQLRYLTDTDGMRHVAIAAWVEGPEGPVEAGVARFVQLSDEPHAVEGAITVVDAFQGIGLGTQLMERLVQAARERGYRTLQAELLLENRPALRMLHRIGGPVSLVRDGSAAIARLNLPAVPARRP